MGLGCPAVARPTAPLRASIEAMQTVTKSCGLVGHREQGVVDVAQRLAGQQGPALRGHHRPDHVLGHDRASGRPDALAAHVAEGHHELGRASPG